MSKKIIENLSDFALCKESTQATSFFNRVGVVGCGDAGQNICFLAAKSGFDVVFVEQSEEKVNAAMLSLSDRIDDIIQHWGLTEGDKRLIMSRIHGYADFEHLKDCDIVIESVRPTRGPYRAVEDRKVIFKQIEQAVSKDTVIATNTATLIVTELASQLEHKDRCVGVFFYQSSTEAKFVEVIRGLHSSDETCAKTSKFITQIGRKQAQVQETPGIIGVRLIAVIINEACEILMQGIANKHDIDETMKVAHGMRFGPFEQADKIGLHKLDRWMEDMYNEYGQVKYKPSPILKQLVRANHIGVATGEGFYKYDENGQIIID